MTDLEITQRLLAIAAELDRLAGALADHPDVVRRAHSRALTSGSVLMRTWALYVPPAREGVR